MSDISTGDTGATVEQTRNDLSEAMEQLSVTSNETSTLPKNLSDMPFDVVGLIIERSDYKGQLLLRKTSKSLRALVDKQKPSCKRLRIRCNADSITLGFDEKEVFYFDDDYEKIAFDDFAFSLKNPKLHLEMLIFEFNNGTAPQIHDKYSKIVEVFKSLPHKTSTRTVLFQMGQNRNYHAILPCLKPGVLESISFLLCDAPESSEYIPYLVSTDQWKQAKELELLFGFVDIPVEHATHFKKIRYWETRIDEFKFVRLRDFLSKLDKFEHCLVFSFLQYDPGELFAVAGRPANPQNIPSAVVFHYSIPESDDYLKVLFFLEDNQIAIMKKKKSDGSF